MNTSVGPVNCELLYLRWKELRDQGQIVDPEELCRSVPHLLPELLRLLEQHNKQTDANGPRSSVVETHYARTTPNEVDIGVPQDHSATLSLVARQGETATVLPTGARARTYPVPNVPGFEIVGLLGTGGMGEVYEAKKLGFNITYALKTIRHDQARERVVERFRREAEAMTHLDHPHIVRVFEVGGGTQPDSGLYLTMRLLRGGSLAQRIQEWQGNVPKSVDLMRKISSAVGYVHEKGLLHRDIKPGNILFDAQSNPYVSDFGLVRDAELETSPITEIDPAHPESLLLARQNALTQTGSVLGTPYYMSPEQSAGELSRIGPWSDVYSLGVVLYELTVGHRPYQVSDVPPYIRENIEIPRPSQIDKLFDRDLESIILKCLEQRPEARYANANDLANALRAWTERTKPFWTRRKMLIGSAALLAGGVGTWAAMRAPETQKAIPVANPLQQIIQELREKGAVDLLRENGTFKWYRPVAGDLNVMPANGGSCTVSSGARNVRLLELGVGLPSPYSLELEIRQEPDSRGFVGLYFGRSLQPTTKGQRHCMLLLYLCDEGMFAPPGKTKGFVAICAASCLEFNPMGFFQTADIVASELTIPPNRWRKIRLDLREASIRVSIDNIDFYSQSRSFLLLYAQNLALGNEGFDAVTPSFRPDDGLGIVVAEATASVRNIRLTLLSNS